MSRGPGRWQRLLLEALAEHENVPVSYVVANHGDTESRSDLVAARRAARRLAEDGRARAIYRRGENRAGHETYLLCLTPPDSQIKSNICPLSGFPAWVDGEMEPSERVPSDTQ